jgi:hypothetical protein
VRETLVSFVRALREGSPFPISIEDGVRAVAIVDAAYRSAERGGEGAAVGGLSGAAWSFWRREGSVANRALTVSTPSKPSLTFESYLIARTPDRRTACGELRGRMVG